ncbi:YopX family protein [Streptococcus uberis]|uniref:YopX family protein n=1 Tax=Streptococcus uberis TaxID=1349 RepID=UPI00193ADB38|nr:YopX family protein [Streptococcus uberis]
MIPKYRGKSIDKSNKGEWVYGNLIVDGNNALIVNGIVECEEDYVALGDWCPVDLKTVGQSIVLFDKNGTEIFDGDVVNAFDYDSDEGKVYKTTDLTGVITYHKNAFCIQSGKILIDLWVHAEEIEIIGNIYENPELIERVEE